MRKRPPQEQINEAMRIIRACRSTTLPSQAQIARGIERYLRVENRGVWRSGVNRDKLVQAAIADWRAKQ